MQLVPGRKTVPALQLKENAIICAGSDLATLLLLRLLKSADRAASEKNLDS